MIKLFYKHSESVLMFKEMIDEINKLQEHVVDLQNCLNVMQKSFYPCQQYHCDCCRFKPPYQFTATITNNAKEK